MDLYALIDHCTVHPSVRMESVLHQLIVTTSQGDPWHIFDLSEQKTYEPGSYEQALSITVALLEAGHDLRVGLTWHDPKRTMEQGWSLAQSFEPCSAIAITSDQLGELNKKNQRARLALYLDPSGGESLLGFVDQILSQPVIHIQLQVERAQLWPGRVYTLSAQTGSPGVLLTVQPDVLSPAAGASLLLPASSKNASTRRPTKWSEHGIPSSEEQDASSQTKAKVLPQTQAKVTPTIKNPPKPAPSNQPHTAKRRQAQPPVTNERLPVARQTED